MALNVVCVQTGNYLGRGAEYVRNLQRQVSQHLTLPHRFVVVTDDALTSYPNATVMRAEHPGWWEKIALFRPGRFADRVMFIDLDTLILGNIDHIAAYGGHFATLHDFWRGRNGLGPAVILFDPKWAGAIYAEWAALGFPKEGNGDQSWIENRDQGRFHRSIDILQELYPGEFVSYKEHCTSGKRNWRHVSDQILPPEGARVVCFHGRPRVHEVGGWVPEVWGGMEVADG